MPASPRVRLPELVDGYEFANSGSDGFVARVHRQTGEVRTCMLDSDEDGDEMPPDFDDPDVWAEVPDKRTLDLGAYLVHRFAEERMPDDVQRIRGIFRSQGAYARFKDLLEHRDKRDEWLAFEADETARALAAWARDEGFEVEGEPRASAMAASGSAAAKHGSAPDVSAETSPTSHARTGAVLSPVRSLQLTIADRVATVTLHRPDKGNALAPFVLDEVVTMFTGLASREDVSVVVFTGGERWFSAGFDLDEIRRLEKVSNESYTALFHRAYRAVLFCEQPVLCAVGGAAIAGGFDLTMMCDVRYASTRAKFGQREIALSLTPIMDPLWRIVGLGRAKEVALTGRLYDANEALAMGYVSKVFPEGELLSSVGAIAREMATFDRQCLAETKRLSNEVLGQGLDGAMRTQEWLFRTYIGAHDNHVRIDALQATLAAQRGKRG